VRLARHEDLPALEWMGLYSGHRNIIESAYEAQQAGAAVMLLAMSGSFPVAQVWIDFRRARATNKAVLWAVRTFFPLHRRGIGRRLMEHAEHAIRARGICEAELEVERSNEPAYRFYQRLGWKDAGPASAGSKARSREPGAELRIMRKVLCQEQC
jgi:ribosomal protein S18 acetylase RimI-like enzyme